MAINPSTANKVSEWFQNYNAPAETPASTSGPGMLDNPNPEAEGGGGSGGAPSSTGQWFENLGSGSGVLQTPPPSDNVNTFGPGGAHGSVDPNTGLTVAGTNVLTGSPNTTTPANTDTTGGNTLTTPTPPPTPTGTPTNTTTPNPAAHPGGSPTGSMTGGILNSNGSTTIDPNALTHRVVDSNTETVAGQMMNARKTPFAQDEAARAVRFANTRGLLNSTMAASAGEEAAVKASLPIAEQDAKTYGDAAGYNTALENQALMYNVDQQNQFQLQSNTIEGQRQIAMLQAATSQNVAGINAAAQLSAATLSAENQRFIAQLNDSTSRYNNDQNYRANQDQNRTTLANNIINNMDLSPDRKQALLNALGLGDLGNAIYVPDEELTNLGGTHIQQNHQNIVNNVVNHR